MLAWFHEPLGDTAPFYTASLAGAPALPSFTAAGADLARDWAWLGSGMQWQLLPNGTIGSHYDLMFNANQTLHTESGNLALAW